MTSDDSDRMMQSDDNWSVVTEYLPPLLLTLRRWQHWWWAAPCPCSNGAGPVVHPGSRRRNHKLIYLPCLYFSLYMRLWSAKSECFPGCLAGPSHSLKRSSWVSNCSAWLSSLFCLGRGELLFSCWAHLPRGVVVDIQSNWLLNSNNKNKWGSTWLFIQYLTDTLCKRWTFIFN